MKAVSWMSGICVVMLAATAYAGCGCCEGGMQGAAPMAAKEEGKAPVKAQTLCPITGKDIDKKISADYQGKRVYFCCNGCPAEFNKDPGKYVKKLQDDGVTLETVGKPQTKCPVMGGDIDRSIFADYQGKRVYFCCGMCPPKFKADPEKYLAAMAKEGVVPEKAPPAEK
jgi:YHS domain-containing protein